MVLRSAGSAEALTSFARQAIREADAAVAIRSVSTVDDVVAASLAPRRFQLTLVMLFAATALLVAVLGVYGIVAFSVASRRLELGMRIALGARPSDLLALVVRQAMVPVAFGLAAGLVLALGLGRMVRTMLFGVGPADPLTIAAVLMLLAVTALFACLVPARAAAASDPIRALRLQ